MPGDLFVPQRAADTTDTEVERLLGKTPLTLSIKHDGVRGLVHGNLLNGKAMTQHRNEMVNLAFSNPDLLPLLSGLDGEFTLLDADFSYDRRNMVQKTSSFLNTSDTSEVDIRRVQFRVFDIYTGDKMPLYERLELADERVLAIQRMDLPHMVTVTSTEVSVDNTIDRFSATVPSDVAKFEAKALKDGYEGIVLRSPFLPYLEGRSSSKGEFLRLKRFQTAEATVVRVVLASANKNPIERDAMGYVKRSSHKEGKVEKPEVGSFICFTNADIYDPHTGELLVKKNQEFAVSATSMFEQQRRYLYIVRDTLPGQILKFKFFPKGILNKPRFATFESWMSEADFSALL